MFRGGFGLEILEKLNPNLLLVFEKITSDKNLSEDFSKCKTGDELYEFCLKIKDGYSREEWEEFIKILYLLTCKEKNIKMLLNDDLSQVGGGTMFNNVKKKLLSGTLAVLSIMPAASTFTPKALAAEPAVSSSVSSSNSRNLQRLKRIILGVGATVVVTAIGVYLYKKVRSNDKNSKKNNNTVNSEVKSENINQKVSILPDDKKGEDENSEVKEDSHENASPYGNGIRNPKNACYMNATMQALYRMRNFRKAVEEDKSGDKQVEALKTMFKIIEKGESAVEPGALEKAARDLGYKEVQLSPCELVESLKPLMEKCGMPNAVVEVIHVPTQEKSSLSMQRILSSNEEEIIKIGEVDKKEKYFMVIIGRADVGQGKAEKLEFPLNPYDVVGAQLRGVVVHSGKEADSGHCTFFANERDGWYSFDDETVKKVSAEQAENGFIYRKGNVNGMLRNGVIYLYERVNVSR